MFHLEVAVDGCKQAWLPVTHHPMPAAEVIARRRNPPVRTLPDDRFRVIYVGTGEIVRYVRFLEREVTGWSEGSP